MCERKIGRIEFLHTDGRVRESVEYTSLYLLKNDVKKENFYGVPMKVVLYRREDGTVVPHEFISECDPPLQGFKIEDYPSYLAKEKERTKEIKLKKGIAKLVSAILTKQHATYFFELPDECSFSCDWSYTVDSYAGNRLYKYSENRSVFQKAKYVSATIERSNNSIENIKICDEDKVEICRENVENISFYDSIISETRDAIEVALKNKGGIS